MITIEEAVTAAHNFSSRIYSGIKLDNLRVEEIECLEDKNVWLITLGWVETSSRTVGGGLAALGNTKIEPLPRVYKIFRVNGDTGNVEKMTMR